VPFLRSEENSDDHSTTADVITEVLNEYKKLNKKFDFLFCIYPTAPFINTRIIHEGLNLLQENNFYSVFPVVRFSYPIQRSLKLEKNKIKMFWPENINRRSQDLEPAYHDSGQFYWLSVSLFSKHKTLFSINSGYIIVDELEAQDIDRDVDWKLAELKFKLLNNLT